MSQYCTDNVEITSLTRKNSSKAFELACQVFVDASVLHTAVNISVDEYREYMHASFEVNLKQGLSLIATDLTNNELVGCLVAYDYTVQQKTSTEVPEKLKPVKALLHCLDEMYREKRQPEAGQFLLVDMAIVKSTARGQGIYRKLRERAHQIGREAGFEWVIGELSSAATQHICVNRFKHKVCAEIEYANFDYKGERPFSAISVPPSIILVEGKLQ